MQFLRTQGLKRMKLCAAVVVLISCMFLYQASGGRRSLDEQRTIGDPFFVNEDDLELEISEDGCSDDISLMVYIHSHPGHFEKRRVIRNTWASRDILQKHHAKLLFITGRVKDDNLPVFLKNESMLNRDIIQGNFYDTYRNLTYKALCALKWVTVNCKRATFVLKTDDDVIVDIDRFVRLTRYYIEHNLEKQPILAGYILANTGVVRNKSSKWYTTYEEFPSTRYFDYCSGSAFVMTYDVVNKFYLKYRETPFFWIDDYFVTGMLAHATNVKHFSLNDRYLVYNIYNIQTQLAHDVNARYLFVHSPDTKTSLYIWRNFLERR